MARMARMARAVFALGVLAGTFTLAHGAEAKIKVRKAAMTVEALGAIGLTDGDIAQARLTLQPQIALRAGRAWRLDANGRVELAAGDTGLGTTQSFSGQSRPLTFGQDARAEIDTLTLVWRQRSTFVTLGKQSVPWGVLDGLQVTDRFSPVRRREAVFTQVRPERISRWGARVQADMKGTRIDAAASFDGTVTQLARAGERFFVTAPRLRGGAPAIGPEVDLPFARPTGEDAITAGLRLGRTIGSADIHVLSFYGPESEPVLALTPTGPALTYPGRWLIGATFEQAAGPRIWRLEVAHVPDQPVNLIVPGTLETARRSRWLAGAALDWKLPKGFFLNMQLGLDHINGAGPALVRPQTDAVATVRIQRSFKNDIIKAAAEVIGSLTDGDGAFRPEVSWQINDQLRASLGGDIIWGRTTGLLGQFADGSRLSLRLTATF